ncbi:alpha-ketoglutarate-dependent dioxygenase AlkB family protein [Rhodalgimonas zhirmunskyi]|uniref:Alpha-ketoglutarate-dependent dioxygenase AlkB n=1 Tax=Rhodalgimonas zhirmunskyi TaxID=2964767 RepID=A0AAJ1UAR9_9RHOB|nr:alpha-ketoglutarate-dependent dioxygenase AlkB [Rhodoalgimonas zhirmunskyi]MDQ2094263.1 alpha-ketoglutarate-dependent dioxygenase AlkB [Rhodoalgimonas zhirmunskyi]
MTDDKAMNLRGVHVFKGALDGAEQAQLVDRVRDIARAAPMFHPETRWGKRMSVKMTSAGQFGWVSDRRGYRYEPRHPSGVDWPPIPAEVLAIWERFGAKGMEGAPLRAPECCLVNYYGEGARMGLHQDRDEADFAQPVVSVSLGDAGLFRVGNIERGGKTESLWLESGDLLVLGGAARLVHHGVDRIRFGSSELLPDAGRINLTLRVVS